LSRLDDLDLTSGAKAGAAVELPAAGIPEADDPLGRAETLAASGSRDGTSALVDLPLSSAAGQSPALSLRAGEAAAPPAPDERAAPLPARGAAFAADAALVLLLAAVALLAATAGRGQSLRIQGLAWTAFFALYLSFFSTVVSLILFGKTVGMALTGLTARGGKGSPLTAAESARRWLGTVLTLAGLGIPLLVTRRNREAPSPGDRMSGRPLTWEAGVESTVNR
jgi:RDD family